MKDLKAEKSPAADLPYYIEMATGDAVSLYATDAIASLTVTDEIGGAITGITIVHSFSGSQILLRISGGTEGDEKRIKVKATLTNPDYKDEVFVTLYVRTPYTA